MLMSSLSQCDLQPGDVICAHVGLKPLGYVPGAGQTVIEAMLDTVRDEGTVMMPSFSGELSDPAEWRVPPVPESWVAFIRAEMPAYDPERTPTRLMGVVAELFRNWPGALRSSHPHSSFTAFGARASELISQNSLDYRFGPNSPLGKLAALDGKVLLLGAGTDRASIVYLAQYLAGIGPNVSKSAPMMIDGVRQWVDYRDIAVDNRLVSSGIEFLLRDGIARSIPIGDSRAIVFSVRAALKSLTKWNWRDADIPISQMRPRPPVPMDWASWLA